MRIVYLNPLAQMGGAEACLIDVLASVRNARPRWELFLITAQGGPLVDRAHMLGVRTKVVEFPSAIATIGDAELGQRAGSSRRLLRLLPKLVWAAAALPAYLWALRRELASLRPTVIHTNGFKMHLAGILVSLRKTPVIWHIHDYVGSRRLMRPILRILARRCSTAITNSQSVARDVTEACGARLAVVPVYNAINLDHFHPDGEIVDLDRLAGMIPGARGIVRVGLLATFARWKGHEVFLMALAKLSQDNRSDRRIRGYVIGGPIYQSDGSQYALDELRAIAAQLGLESQVGFTGFVDNPAAVLRSLDIVVHASTKPEPFGLVIAEAMACGRAVVVSKAGGAEELISDQEDALCTSPGDVGLLASAILRLAESPGLRLQLGRAARHTAERRFDRRRLARELMPIYESVGAA